MADTLLAPTISLVDELVQVAIERGDGPGLLSLRHRLQALLAPPDPPRGARAQEQAGIDAEHGIWTAGLLELLLPEVRAHLVTELRASREKAGLAVAHDPWVALDDDATRARGMALANRMQLAQRATTGVCRRYERTRRTSHLRDAVGELEEAVEFERHHVVCGLRADTCAEEADCLGQALERVLPPSAFRFFAGVLRGLIAREVPASRRRPVKNRFGPRGAGAEQWLSLKEWTDPCYGEERAKGAWFVSGLQDRYDQAMEGARLREKEANRREAEERFRASLEWEPPARNEGGAEERAIQEADDSLPRDGEVIPAPDSTEAVTSKELVTVHFVEDGFTAFERVWCRGMELTLARGSEGWARTCDRDGDSWLDVGEAEQLRRYGKVHFRPGPWPGEPWRPEERASFRKDYSSRDSWEDSAED